MPPWLLEIGGESPHCPHASAAYASLDNISTGQALKNISQHYHCNEQTSQMYMYMHTCTHTNTNICDFQVRNF